VNLLFTVYVCFGVSERLVDKSELIMTPEEATSQHSEKAYVNVFGPYSQSEELH